MLDHTINICIGECAIFGNGDFPSVGIRLAIHKNIGDQNIRPYFIMAFLVFRKLLPRMKKMNKVYE